MSFHTSLVNTYRSIQRLSVKRRGYKAVKTIANMPSYFPEESRKDEATRVRENREWVKKYGEANDFYTLYGFDRVSGPDQSKYMDYLEFRNTREEANRVGHDDCEVVLLRDKLLFFDYMRSHSLPVPDVFAYIRNGKVFNMEYQEIPFQALTDEKDYFLKDQGGECASFVKHIKDFETLKAFRTKVSTGSFILQRKVVQSAEMDVLNPHAINTLRIVTINKDGRCFVLSSLLRVGTSKTGNVDNWAAGGLAIGIQETGYLKQYGFYKPVHGLKESVHPDTGIVFNEFKVPQYEGACRLACQAHRFFFNVRAIGWDVAISENGPVFIEGNDNFEISLHQACDRPLKKEWFEAIAD